MAKSEFAAEMQHDATNAVKDMINRKTPVENSRELTSIPVSATSRVTYENGRREGSTATFRTMPDNGLTNTMVSYLNQIPYHTPLRPKSTFRQSRRSIFDLPPEIRVTIFSLALENVIIHIVPISNADRSSPHALACASKQVRQEVLPLMRSLCRIESTVTDLRFDGLLGWLANIPPEQQYHLCKNERLLVRLCFTGKEPPRQVDTLRRWLHDRADPCRSQPHWMYTGPVPGPMVVNDLRRRWKRMGDVGKKTVLRKMCRGMGVELLRPGEHVDI